MRTSPMGLQPWRHLRPGHLDYPAVADAELHVAPALHCEELRELLEAYARGRVERSPADLEDEVGVARRAQPCFDSCK